MCGAGGKKEDAYFDESGIRYISGRQKEMLLVPRRAANIEP